MTAHCAPPGCWPRCCRFITGAAAVCSCGATWRRAGSFEHDAWLLHDGARLGGQARWRRASPPPAELVDGGLLTAPAGHAAAPVRAPAPDVEPRDRRKIGRAHV